MEAAESPFQRAVTGAQLWVAVGGLLLALLTAALAGAAHVARLETTVERHVEQPSHYRTAEQMSAVLERLARIETKLDHLKERADGRRP